MLEKLLSEIKNGNTTSPTVLAEKLNTSTAMVQAMLQTLADQGYLQMVSPGCETETPCESCALAGMCNTKEKATAKIYVVK